MRNADARLALIEALGTVGILSPSPDKPPVVTGGAAWPVWVRTNWTNACLPVGSWHVFVALPAGSLGTTSQAGDTLADTVAEALMPVAKLAELVPWEWIVEIGGTSVPGLRYTVEV